MKFRIFFFLLFLSTFCFGQNARIFTGKCAISQTGSGSGYWQVGITNFNDPGGQFDATEIDTSDYLLFSDGGTPYSLEVTGIISASGATATIKVSNVGVTGISSVPTTSSSAISRGSAVYKVFPWISNIPGNENQLQSEYHTYQLDSIINALSVGGGTTDLTFTGSGPYTLNSSNGSDVTISQGTGVILTRVGNDLEIAASGGGGGATDLTFTGSASPYTLNSSTGTDVTIAQGNNMTITRSSNQLTIASNSSVLTVSDLINGLDISNSAGTVTVAPNIPELTTTNTYDANDNLMFYDNSAAGHRKMALGTYLASGFVDKTSTQVDIGGDKGFTTSVHYGATSLPTSSAFGTGNDTPVFFKGGTGDVTESNFQSSSGLVIKTVVDGSNGDNTTKLIATGSDTGNNAGAFKFYTRNNQVSANWVQGLHIYNTASGTLSLFGNADVSSLASVCVPSSGIGITSAGNGAYKFQTAAATNHTFQLIQDGGFEVAYCDQSVTGWKDPSDYRLKDNIRTLSVLDNISRLRGVSYTMKDGGKPNIGVIAQEVQEVFPQIVSENADTKMLGVSYSGISAIALQGVRELYEENRMLKTKIEALEKRLEALEK